MGTERTPRNTRQAPAKKEEIKAGSIVLSNNVANNLSAGDQVFLRTLPFAEFKAETGLMFKKPMASKDQNKNCFILAKYPDSEDVDFVLPCGQSVEPGDNLEELEFGEIESDNGEGNIWLAYRPSEAGGGVWS